MNEKKDNLSWVILGLVIFIVFMAIYIYMKPKYLGSPGDLSSSPLPSYFNTQTGIVALSALLGSLLLAFGIDRIRKKLDSKLLEEDKKSKKK